MALRKSELYSSLWSSCDELRGGMDASQYKDYVLVLLFIKYISDKYAGVPYAPITIPKGASFKDMVALKGKPDIGDQINKTIIAPLANENKLSDLPDFNDATKLGSGKEMVDRLTNLIAIFETPALDFSKNRAEGDDILGDAYEYLMRHFAIESGKSKGQFLTPAEVSRIIAQIVGIRSAKTTSATTVYDPTCGSGSLLLKVADEAHSPVTLYGQEKDAATAGLARMNMILHNNPTALIAQANTLTDPKFKDGDTLKTFDYVVANPPFSDKRWSTGLDPLNDPHQRFQSFGTPPAKQGDYAYLLHIVRSLKSSGKGACILPHGVLFRGNAEADIRRSLVRKGYIKGIIGLPANLFYGTGIPACIVVIDKQDAHTRKGIFMIDASAGFMKDGPKNRLRAQDIHRIVDVFNRQADTDKYARMVSFAEIEKNDFNLNLPRYIDSQQAEDRQDIAGHLQGGIPAADVDALQAYWTVCPELRETLFTVTPPGPQASSLHESAAKPGPQASSLHESAAKMGPQASSLHVESAAKMAALRPQAAGRTAMAPDGIHGGWHSRGYLPHFDDASVVQFITFRLADSVPQTQIEAWKRELEWREGLAADSPQAVALRKHIDRYEDAGHGACHLRDPRIAALVQDALMHFDGQRYRLMAWCIMPNHVHVLLETGATAGPEGHPLASILHSWKSFTATRANKMLGRSGSFWMPEYFDRYIRNAEHFHDTLAYIRDNPVKAGFVRRPDEWAWSSAGLVGNAGFQPAGAIGGQAGTAGFQPARGIGGQDGRGPGYVNLAVDKTAIKTTIYEHPEFTAFIDRMNALFAEWRGQSAVTLKALSAGCQPKSVIADLAEDILAHYVDQPLIGGYDVYQHLMDYWAETMQDDCYLIAADGWKAETRRILVKDKNGREKDKGWTCDLVPKELIVARYFVKEQATVDKLAARLEGAAAQIAELEEEHGGEDGAFSELDKVNKASVTARLQEISGTAGTRASSPQGTAGGQDGRAPAEDDEAAMLRQWLKLSEAEAGLKRELKAAGAALDARAYALYPKLSAAEVKVLVVDDKWLAALDAAIHGEMDRISQALTQRVKELAERYDTPLPQMTGRVAELEAKVNAHLKKMGFEP